MIEADKTRTYTAGGIKKAQQLKKDFLDENFLILLYVQIDILSLIATETLFHQYYGQTVIGKGNSISKPISNLDIIVFLVMLSGLDKTQKLVKSSILKAFQKEIQIFSVNTVIPHPKNLWKLY